MTLKCAVYSIYLSVYERSVHVCNTTFRYLSCDDRFTYKRNRRFHQRILSDFPPLDFLCVREPSKYDSSKATCLLVIRRIRTFICKNSILWYLSKNSEWLLLKHCFHVDHGSKIETASLNYNCSPRIAITWVGCGEWGSISLVNVLIFER